MALRNQPYIPLYVQDIMTDEKLNECSASAHGIYIKGIMCLMHKSEYYGKILLKQKFKQGEDFCLLFALQLDRHLPYTVAEIKSALDELILERVCYFEVGDNVFLCQKRMIKDNDISIKRSLSGSKGGKKTQFAKAKPKANVQANSEDEIEDEIISKIKVSKAEEEVIQNLWNSFAEKNQLSKLLKLSDKRKKHIKQRLKEKEFNFEEILSFIEKQPFLLGENNREWKVDFDWIFSSKDNYLKILEEKYASAKQNLKRDGVDENGRFL